MRNYQQAIDQFGHEIADDSVRKERNPEWDVTFHKSNVAKSLSILYSKSIMTVTRDLEKVIKEEKIKMNDPNRLKENGTWDI